GSARTRASPSAPVPATSTRWRGAGKAWRTCSAIKAGSSSMSSRWAMVGSVGAFRPGRTRRPSGILFAIVAPGRAPARGIRFTSPAPRRRRCGPLLTGEVAMHEKPRARLVAYGVAVLATAVSLLVRWPLWPVLGDAVPHMTFFPAVMLAAYLGGFRPGLLAPLLSAAAANHFPTRQPAPFRVNSVNDVPPPVLFRLVGPATR